MPEAVTGARPSSGSGLDNTLIRGGSIADPTTRMVRQADILVEDGRVRSIQEPGHEMRAEHVVDVSGCLVLPGLINAHSHSYAPLVRNVAQGLPLEPWMMHCWAYTIGRTPEETYLSAMLQGIEALQTGTTTVLDHLGGDVDVMSAALRAYQDLGIRAVLAPMIADLPLSQTIGVPLSRWPLGTRPADPALASVDGADLIAATEALHADWHGREDRLSVYLGPSGPQRCSVEMMEQIAAVAERLDVGVHTHLLETRVQARTPTHRRAPSWVRVLADVGLLTSRLSLAHGVWLTDAEMDDLAVAGASVVHNPQSNLQLGSGIAQLPSWRRHGLSVGLGTDGVNCGGSMDMLASMRLAALIHRPGLADPQEWETPWSVLDAATRGSARALSMPDIGAIEPGLRADLAAFDLSGTVHSTRDDPLAALILSSYDHHASMVMVGGRVVVQDRKIRTIDESAVVEQAARLQRGLIQRNRGYAELASVQEDFLTRISVLARPDRQIIPFTVPPEWEPPHE